MEGSHPNCKLGAGRSWVGGEGKRTAGREGKGHTNIDRVSGGKDVEGAAGGGVSNTKPGSHKEKPGSHNKKQTAFSLMRAWLFLCEPGFSLPDSTMGLVSSMGSQ